PEQFDEAMHPIMRPIMDKYLADDPVAAVDGIFSVLFDPDWRAEVSRTVPGGHEQADQDAATFFESDVLPGQEWHFGAEQAAKITQPVLFLTGTESLLIFGEVRDPLHAYLPQVEDDVMPEPTTCSTSATPLTPRQGWPASSNATPSRRNSHDFSGTASRTLPPAAIACRQEEMRALLPRLVHAAPMLAPVTAANVDHGHWVLGWQVAL
ncbi:MAG TPA: hypothetical protein VF003_09925, partial [Pseudonocardiaceae bacterium]